MGGIRHTFVSGIADGGDATLARPSDWNAAHSGVSALAVEASDFATTSVSPTFVDVTGLTWAVGASQTWIFRFDLVVFSSVATVGVFIALNGPTIGAGIMDAIYEYKLTATTYGNSIQTAYNSVSTQPATGLTTRHLNHFVGKITTGATAGVCAVRVAAEAAGTVTIGRGSGGYAMRVV